MIIVQSSASGECFVTQQKLADAEICLWEAVHLVSCFFLLYSLFAFPAGGVLLVFYSCQRLPQLYPDSQLLTWENMEPSEEAASDLGRPLALEARVPALLHVGLGNMGSQLGLLMG